MAIDNSKQKSHRDRKNGTAYEAWVKRKKEANALRGHRIYYTFIADGIKREELLRVV